MPRRYRKNIADAVKFFRPILTGLKIRANDESKTLYLALFDRLSVLDLDNWRITVIYQDDVKMQSVSGMFFYRREQDYLIFYIIINKSLFLDKTKEKLKLTGVHEFCHFIAYLYAITSTTIELQKKNFEAQLLKKCDILSEEALNNLYKAINDRYHTTPDELNDEHFRLEWEGNTPDYVMLFKHFMLSKELFDLYFDTKDQEEFRRLVTNNKSEDTDKAMKLLGSSIAKVVQDKSVPQSLAINQVISWAKDYI